MDTTPSSSTSQAALLNQMEAMGVKSTTSIYTLSRDTPVPRENISNETLQLLEEASSKINPAKKGIKRFREESPANDNRNQYPNESKPIYLKVKSLHKKKLAIATNLHQIKQGIAENKYPNQANFRCTYPPNRDETFKKSWQQIIKKCKEDLTFLVIQDLNQKYQETKADIQSNLDQLNNVLNQQQFQETKKFLDDRYKAAMPAAMNRASGKFNRRFNPRSKPTRPNWRGRSAKNQANTKPRKGKEPLKDALTALLAQL